MKGEISPGAGAVEEEFDHGVSCVFGASLDSGIALLAPRNGAPFRQLPGLVAEHVLSRFVVQRLLLEFADRQDRKSTRLNSSHSQISYAVFCLKKKKTTCITGLALKPFN